MHCQWNVLCLVCLNNPLRTTLANSQSALPHALISSKSPPRHWTSGQMRLHARALLLNFNSLKKLAYPCRVNLAWSMMIIAGGTSHTLPACPLGKNAVVGTYLNPNMSARSRRSHLASPRLATIRAFKHSHADVSCLGAPSCRVPLAWGDRMRLPLCRVDHYPITHPTNILIRAVSAMPSRVTCAMHSDGIQSSTPTTH